MKNTYRIYNINLVDGRVLSTSVCPVLVDQNLQPHPYFIVPVAVEKHPIMKLNATAHRYFNLRINQQNVLFVDETVITNLNEIAVTEALFNPETITSATLNSDENI
jgi:hypothetical protein